MTKKYAELDALFSQFIRMRAIKETGGCERCGGQKYDIQKENGKIYPAFKQLQCSHFIGRSKSSVRLDEDNAAGLCGACHLYFTAHPLEHVEWFTKRLGEEKLNLLLARVRTREKPDMKLLTLYYKMKLEEME